VKSEILKIRRIKMENDEVVKAIKEYVEKYHEPKIVFTGNEDVLVKHSLTPDGQYMGANVEIVPLFRADRKGIGGKSIEPDYVDFGKYDIEPTEEELAEHTAESAEVGEPIHPDQMMKDLMGKSSNVKINSKKEKNHGTM